jgi:hypothetical protein
MSEEKKKVTAKKAVKKPRIAKVKKEESPKSVDGKSNRKSCCRRSKIRRKACS